MRLPFALLPLFGSLVLAACGGPAPGDSCSTNGFLCATENSAMECRLGTWRELPCRGPQGCRVEGDTVSCDMSLNREGDACAATTEGAGICESSGFAALQCRQGTLIRTPCTTCTVSGEQVLCAQ